MMSDDEREPAHECGNCGDFKWKPHADCPVGKCVAYDRTVLPWDTCERWWNGEDDDE